MALIQTKLILEEFKKYSEKDFENILMDSEKFYKYIFDCWNIADEKVIRQLEKHKLKGKSFNMPRRSESTIIESANKNVDPDDFLLHGIVSVYKKKNIYSSINGINDIFHQFHLIWQSRFNVLFDDDIKKISTEFLNFVHNIFLEKIENPILTINIPGTALLDNIGKAKECIKKN